MPARGGVGYGRGDVERRCAPREDLGDGRRDVRVLRLANLTQGHRGRVRHPSGESLPPLRFEGIDHRRAGRAVSRRPRSRREGSRRRVARAARAADRGAQSSSSGKQLRAVPSATVRRCCSPSTSPRRQPATSWCSSTGVRSAVDSISRCSRNASAGACCTSASVCRIAGAVVRRRCSRPSTGDASGRRTARTRERLEIERVSANASS